MDCKLSLGPILQILGQGCYGVVYRGTLGSQPIAAKKCYKASSVRDEARLLGLCYHPNVVRSFGVYVYESELFLVMELAGDGSLQKSLGNNAFNSDARIRLVQQICDGLDHIHEQGIVHRDVRPANLLLKCIALPHIVIGDFGCAQLLSDSIESSDRHPLVDDRVYTLKSDVLLLGLTVVKIYEDENLVSPGALARHLQKNGLNISKYEKQSWRSMIMKSLDKNQDVRPTAREFRKAFAL